MKLKAGKYFIGDPCYAIKDELWSEFCNNLFNAEAERNFTGEVILRGVKIFVSNTQYGDGCYEDQYGNSYSVDAGLIGAVPLEEGITKEENEFADLGLIVDIDRDFNCYYLDEDGTIEINGHIIETGFYEDDYVYWEEEGDDWGDDEDDY